MLHANGSRSLLLLHGPLKHNDIHCALSNAGPLCVTYTGPAPCMTSPSFTTHQRFTNPESAVSPTAAAAPAKMLNVPNRTCRSFVNSWPSHASIRQIASYSVPTACGPANRRSEPIEHESAVLPLQMLNKS